MLTILIATLALARPGTATDGPRKEILGRWVLDAASTKRANGPGHRLVPSSTSLSFDKTGSFVFNLSVPFRGAFRMSKRSVVLHVTWIGKQELPPELESRQKDDTGTLAKDGKSLTIRDALTVYKFVKKGK